MRAENIRQELEFARESATKSLAIGAAMAATGWNRRAKRLERDLAVIEEAAKHYPTRYTYGYYRTEQRALDALEDMYAAGEVSQGEEPRIEVKRDHRKRITHYEITLQAD